MLIGHPHHGQWIIQRIRVHAIGLFLVNPRVLRRIYGTDGAHASPRTRRGASPRLAKLDVTRPRTSRRHHHIRSPRPLRQRGGGAPRIRVRPPHRRGWVPALPFLRYSQRLVPRGHEMRGQDLRPRLRMQEVLRQRATRAEVVELQIFEVAIRQVVDRFHLLHCRDALERTGILLLLPPPPPPPPFGSRSNLYNSSGLRLGLRNASMYISVPPSSAR